MIGNITGMAAALIYRDIRFIEVPTIMIGQSGSTLSNKQAINGKTGKNQFGTYYSLKFILADIKYLETESPRHSKTAIVEGIRNAFISDADLLEDFERLLFNKKFPLDEITAKKQAIKVFEISIKKGGRF